VSEYQYYEFLAIDRPLDDDERAEIRSLSTRARITATSFVNEYHWGNFKGDPNHLMEHYYDAHLYVANWGTHRVNTRGLHPIRRGLTFHGLRHSHKTWLIADLIPEIAQARRLGHRLDNRIVETYSHVAPEVEHQLLTALEDRWHAATHNDPPPVPDPTGPDDQPLAPVVPLFAGTRDTTSRHWKPQRPQRKYTHNPGGRGTIVLQKRSTWRNRTGASAITQDRLKKRENPPTSTKGSIEGDRYDVELRGLEPLTPSLPVRFYSP